MDPNQAGYKGFKDYTRRMLRIYDPWVLGVMAPRVWKSGSEPGLDLYRRHMRHRHLDVGRGRRLSARPRPRSKAVGITGIPAEEPTVALISHEAPDIFGVTLGDLLGDRKILVLLLAQPA